MLAAPICGPICTRHRAGGAGIDQRNRARTPGRRVAGQSSFAVDGMPLVDLAQRRKSPSDGTAASHRPTASAGSQAIGDSTERAGRAGVRAPRGRHRPVRVVTDSQGSKWRSVQVGLPSPRPKPRASSCDLRYVRGRDRVPAALPVRELRGGGGEKTRPTRRNAGGRRRVQRS
jgi:hypothetical protein